MRGNGNLKLMVDVGFFRHPKLRMLARRLDVHVKDAGWAVLNLWGWTMDWHENGDITGTSDATLADAAGWAAPPEKFVATLRRADEGFGPWIDGATSCTNEHENVGPEHKCLHDWMEHQGRLLRQRERSRVHRMTDEPMYPSDPLVAAFSFCATPGYGAKKRALHDLTRQGVDSAAILNYAATPEARVMDFWAIINRLRPPAPKQFAKSALTEAMKRGEERANRAAK